MQHPTRWRHPVLTILLTGGLIALAPTGASGASCVSWAGNAPPNPGGTAADHSLLGVSVLSSCNAWAVGYSTNAQAEQETLILHWDGSGWAQVPSPNPAGASQPNALFAVAATGPKDAWAVGFTGSPAHNLTLHWDGFAWTQTFSPSPGDQPGLLEDVTAVSPTEAWAVGWSGSDALILHWNGTAWKPKLVPSGDFSEFGGVTASSPKDVWAVGRYGSAGIHQRTLITHWNGRSWKTMTSPNPGGASMDHRITGVAATSASNAWAVGAFTPDAGSVKGYRPFILRWNGTAWKAQATPRPTGNDALTDVVAISATNAWAVGNSWDVGKSLAMRWNGSSWALVKTPNGPDSDTTRLADVDATSSSDIWAVGQYKNSTAYQTFAIHCC